ncbi:MAG: hypothetical protein RMJ59_02130 [Candidatus Nitrosocaldus sp.]|nr:hypothetical protein [Candidatus Nitrosocaldus sp.]MCS7141551.1 hypothetical protein [Candidatus Nitrosocaldus sp.]MDW8000329.1 hypothetical protein [Candidatus Nitrosocaldus sp.]MDW8275165.1 hypothetical protein [Candidatus Nitrosocaldus sp.]
MILFGRRGDGKGREGEVDDGDKGESAQHQPKPDSQPRSSMEVSLEEFMTMVDRLDTSRDSTPKVREAIHITRRLNQHMDALNGVAEALLKRKISTDLTPQMRGMVERARSTVASVIVEVSRPIPEPAGLGEIALVQERASRVLNRIGDILGSHRRILYEFFPGDARALKDTLMAMKRDVDTLDGMVKGIDEEASLHSRFRDRVARLVQAEREIKVHSAKIRELKGMLDALEARRATIERRRDEVSKAQGYAELKGMLSKARSEYDALLSDIAREFSRLSRVISKYAYEVGFEREQYSALKAVMDEPSRLGHVSIYAVRDALARLRDGIASGRLHMKNPEKDMENVQDLMERLEAYAVKCREYERVIASYSERIAPHEEMLRGIDADLEHIDREIRDARDMLDDYSSRIDALRSTLSEEVERLMDDAYGLYGLNVRIRIGDDHSC